MDMGEAQPRGHAVGFTMLQAWCPSPCLLLSTPYCQQAEQPSKRDGHSLSIPLGEGTVC